ncbi:glycogen/starch/alpha-glucan phosphorylase [Roseomonas sp. BN140053]|uniref:glycogen/starch/alpha-glucan phosphorylase n=1 Tax=Roseomonas sp. BN140053 TaxID=3391898 RepID=UPI0039E7E53F
MDTIAAPAHDLDSTTSGSPPRAEVEELRQSILSKLIYQVGGTQERASERDWFLAAALATRDRIVDGWRTSNTDTRESGDKQVCYMSLEFLIGRLLSDALGNLGLTETVREALKGLGVELDAVLAQEADAALGNGGLGRLAACFMESMASIGIPAYGYGIRYEHGLFRQVIEDGQQHELPEDWLNFGNPWEFERAGISYDIGFGGYVQAELVPGGIPKLVWHPSETVRAVAYDTPVVGWRGKRVNTLRLWSARAKDPLRLAEFNRGDHVGAQTDRVRAEAISRVLYPGDETPAGQELRLRQEYFFASASLQDMLRRQLALYGEVRSLADKVAVQLNDTHPAIGVAELMRLLLDVHGLEWDEAWDITRATFSYTNHTLMPEALEAWPVSLMERLLPRNMQLIYLINARHLDAARREGGNDALLAAVSLIDEEHGRRVRMGHLAFVGSHKINGVSALHTGLMRQTVFADLNRVLPGRITNKTNGITFRRWLLRANPGLTRLLVDTLGEGVLDDPGLLEGLADHAGDPAFQNRFAAQRRVAKEALASLIAQRIGVAVDPAALFDVQIKRIHEYKRQLLNVLQTVALYNAMRARPTGDWVPRVKVFAGKAAASYHQAKLIIRLAHDVARVVNNDPTVHGMLKVAFLPNYNVSLAEMIIPAADLSEQISTAGLEASGTGNMKLALNGAITIGTLDGANVEIRERVGPENIVIFGLTAAEVAARKQQGYDARAAVAASPSLAGVLDAVASGVFSPEEPGRYRGLVDGLLNHDTFLVTADFDSYDAAQREVAARWNDPAAWWRASILNTARVGWFSSDRTIREYAEEIWGLPPR